MPMEHVYNIIYNPHETHVYYVFHIINSSLFNLITFTNKISSRCECVKLLGWKCVQCGYIQKV